MQRTMLSKWAGPVAIVATGIAMLWWSWGKWPDVIIDFGKEIYMGWQLASGKTLYTDIAHYKGPLPPYLNSLWFRWFGVSLRTLVICNLAILAGVTLLLYQLFKQTAGRLSATVACLVFLTVFAFSQYVGIGNYNFLCPYSHDMTHGTALSLAAIYSLSVAQQRKSLWPIAGAGFALGLIFLTKAELFVAAALALTMAVGLLIWQECIPRARAFAAIACFFGAALLPPVAAFWLLRLRMPVHEAFLGMLGSWPWSLDPAYTTSLFHRQGMGFVDPGGSVKAMLFWCVRYTLVFVPAAVVAFACPRLKLSGGVVAVAVAIIVVGALGDRWQTIPWLEAARPLPLAIVLLAAVTLMEFRGKRGDAQRSNALITRLALIVFAAVLLGRMILNARIYHYGFVLAMPATLLIVVALIGWVPEWINRRGGNGTVFRAAALGALLVAVFAHLQIVGRCFGWKTFRVGSGADSFLADARGSTVNMAVEEMGRRLGPRDTLAVVPEGLLINYLARRANSTPYIELTTSILMFGVDRVCASYQANPPDYLVWLYRDMTEFGFGSFEQGYGKPLSDWMQQNYRVVKVVKNPDLPDPRFNIFLMERKRSE